MTIATSRVSPDVTPTMPTGSVASLSDFRLGGNPQNRTSRQPIRNDGVLVAGGGLAPIRPNPTPVSPKVLVDTWGRAIMPALPGSNPTSQVRPSPTGRAVINAPTLGQGQPGSSALSTMFGPGRKMINSPDVPQLTGVPTDTTMAVVQGALTDARVSQFAALDQNQKMLARSLFVAAVDALNKGQLSPQAFDEVIGHVLVVSQQTKFAAPMGAPKPNIDSQRIPGQVETVPTLARRPGEIDTNEIVPLLAPRPSSPVTPLLGPNPDESARRSSEPTFIVDSSSDLKIIDVKDFLGAIPANQLPAFQKQPTQETAMSAQGNGRIKADDLKKIQDIPAWLILADAAAAQGYIPPSVPQDLRLWHDYGINPMSYHQPLGVHSPLAFQNEAEIWRYLADIAEKNGHGLDWEALRQRPMIVITDDSKTEIVFSQNGHDVPLTFKMLDEACKSLEKDPTRREEYDAVMKLRQAVEKMADNLWASRTNQALDRGDIPITSRDKFETAWHWYLDKLGDHGLLGPDGAPIASLLGPADLLNGLKALAEYQGLQFEDLKFISTSYVTGTVIYSPSGWSGQSSYQAVGRENYQPMPWSGIENRIRNGEPVHFDNILYADPQKQLSIAQHQQQRTSQDPLRLAREHALAGPGGIKEQIENDTKQKLPPPKSQPQLLSPLTQDNTVLVVVPLATTTEQRAQLKEKVEQAWQSADSAHHPKVQFMNLEQINPEDSSRLHGASSVILVSPEYVLSNPRDSQALDRQFVAQTLNLAIDGSVGPPLLASKPVIVLGDVGNKDTAAGQSQQLHFSLYRDGPLKNESPIIFTDPKELNVAIQNYWSRTKVRPSDTQPLRTSSRLAEPLPSANPPGYYYPVYGYAGPLVDPAIVETVKPTATALIFGHAKRDNDNNIIWHSKTYGGVEAITQLGKELGVAPPTSADLTADYYARLEAALQQMPGNRIERIGDLGLTNQSGERSYRIWFPQLDKPVNFPNGGGIAPYDSRSGNDPTQTVMGAFSSLTYLAMVDGNLTYVKSRAVTTPQLELTEGRPGALPRTNEKIYADDIAQRTDEVSRGGDVAFSWYGGIGTKQEELLFPGLLVRINPKEGESNRMLQQLREADGLPTLDLRSDEPNFQEILMVIAQASPRLNPRNADWRKNADALVAEIKLLRNNEPSVSNVGVNNVGILRKRSFNGDQNAGQSDNPASLKRRDISETQNADTSSAPGIVEFDAVRQVIEKLGLPHIFKESSSDLAFLASHQDLLLFETVDFPELTNLPFEIPSAFTAEQIKLAKYQDLKLFMGNPEDLKQSPPSETAKNMLGETYNRSAPADSAKVPSPSVPIIEALVLPPANSSYVVLKNLGYASYYDDARHNPAIVVYDMDNYSHNTAPRKKVDRWSTDSRTASQVQHIDYSKSGYTRGHLAPNSQLGHGVGLLPVWAGDPNTDWASGNWPTGFNTTNPKTTPVVQIETFKMSNMVPQSAITNNIVIERLETYEGKIAQQLAGRLTVLTGPVYEVEAAVVTISSKKIAVPDAFFRILVQEDPATGELHILPMWIPHLHSGNSTNQPVIPASFLTTLENIEKATGFTFFPSMPEAQRKNLLRASPDPARWPGMNSPVH